MRSQLVLIHRSLGEGSVKPFNAVSGAAVWTTCLRSIAVGEGTVPESLIAHAVTGDQVLSGPPAYQFLLETVCGLKSPVLGETEVHGQFKKFLDEAKAHLSSAMFKALHQVHVDAKRIRASCLQDLGSQSYGSFCRRLVRGLQGVNLVGSGHLANELLPWLVKSKTPIRLFCRSAEQKKADFHSRFKNLAVEELFTGSPLGGALIIAAPVKSQELMAWMEKTGHNVELVIDLRAESAQDPMPALLNGEVINLKNVFEAIESARVKINSEIEKARAAIQQIIQGSSAHGNTQPTDQNFGSQKRSRKAAGVSSRPCA
jgi:glutamyl-tRNA reductase